MNRRHSGALLAVLVGLSLLGAPVTMADWGEQATVSVERADEPQAGERSSVVRYEDLSEPARTAVRRAIESSDGRDTVYGQEDWPSEFRYGDDVGYYTVVYDGQYYALRTYGGGGFPVLYWLLELPFVAYGTALVGVAHRTHAGSVPPRLAALAAVPGLGFHLLGPEFDFPLVPPVVFVALGALTLAVLTALSLGEHSEQSHRTDGD